MWPWIIRVSRGKHLRRFYTKMQDYMRKWNLGGLASNNGGILAPVQVFVTLFSATGSLKKGPFFGKVYFGCIFWLFFSDRSSQLLAFVWLLRKCSKQELTLKTWDENTWITIFTWRNWATPFLYLWGKAWYVVHSPNPGIAKKGRGSHPCQDL